MKTIQVLFLIAFLAALGSLEVRTQTITLKPSEDTTLFEALPTNNLGRADLTSGSTALPSRSRALVKFDPVGAVPNGATIESVTLTLLSTKQPAGATGSVYRLFKVLRPWVEGDKTGVHGDAASPGETTWNERVAGQAGGGWSAPGGAAPHDFVPTASSALFIKGEGVVTFPSSTNMVADVQAWLKAPANNHGWIIITDSEAVSQSVTHFASREETSAPVLTIGYADGTSATSKVERAFALTNVFRIGFAVPALRKLSVQSSDSLSPANWVTLTNVPPPSFLTQVFVLDTIKSKQRFYRLAELNPKDNLVFIPPGNFKLGSPTNEIGRFGSEGPQVAVTISRGFWMGRYSVTQREYAAVMGVNPANHVGPDLPVEQVSWFDATNYCARLTQQERAAGRIGTNEVYRLPTEAEWEYACRAGTTTRFSFGDDFDYTILPLYAWYQNNSGNMTHPVGQKLPNQWGLYDIYGNVLNWCQDWWGPYLGGSAVDPQGPATGTMKVIRGGAWLRVPSHTRSAFRHSFDPVTRNILIGFRVILAPAGP